MANGTNYDDERFAEVEADKQEALSDLEQTYAGMIENTDKYYEAQINASKEWADKQSQLQQEQTDFAIEQIEQQQEQAQKDYTKEQSGAYVDWRKQSNEYGAEAEKMASAGLTRTGYSESSQVSMYNTYQNRVTTAREAFDQAVLNYNNAIKDAQLQNNAALAEIAYQALQQQIELSLQGFQYKNQLILEQAEKKTEIENTYYNRYLDVLDQINTEKALAASYSSSGNYYSPIIEKPAEEPENENPYGYSTEEVMSLQRAARVPVTGVWNTTTQSAYNAGYRPTSTNNSVGNTTLPSAQVQTAYYSGSLNSDASKYGTFSNGYQPKGITGHGKLSKSGDTITFDTQTLYGQKQTVTQNIWKAEDGTKWYWDGRYNKYFQIK